VFYKQEETNIEKARISSSRKRCRTNSPL